MKRSVVIVSLPLLGALSAGCVVRARAGVASDPGPPVFVEPPTLVAVDSGVWVVRDADYPVYYVDDEYWGVRDGVWYRSRYYDRDWVTVQPTVVPAPIAQRDHNVYVHFRGEAGAQTRVAPGAHEVVEPTQVAPAATPMVRSEAPTAPRGELPAPARERRDNEDRANESRRDDVKRPDNGPATMRRAEEPRTQVRPDERRPNPPAPIPARRVEDQRPPAVKHDERKQGAPAPRPARRIDEEKQADPNQREKSTGKKP